MEHRVLRGLIPEAITSVIITTKACATSTNPPRTSSIPGSLDDINAVLWFSHGDRGKEKKKTEHAALQYDGASQHSRLKVNRAKDGM